jgi:hypothetical protein
VLERLCLCLALAAGLPASGGPVQARLQVPGIGPQELVLPPALHREALGGGLDLALLGPDGKARAFELFWGGTRSERQVDLVAASCRLQGQAVVWEAELPRSESVAAITVAAAEEGFSGRLQVDLVGGRGAGRLAQDQALFSGQPYHQDVPGLPQARRLCLTLSGMDARFRSRARLVGAVTVTLRSLGLPAVTQTVALKALGVPMEGAGPGQEEWRAVLPGSGLFLESVEARTGQALLGTWQLGQERLVDGRPAFGAAASGALAALSPQARTLVLPVDAVWGLKDLRLRFDGQGRPVGLSGLSAKLRLPRLSFDADQAGVWTLVAGNGGEAVQVADSLDRPGAPLLLPGPVREDPAWQPAQAAERFATRGGPFVPDGYAWNAAVQVPGPGFWRLSLPWKEALEGRAEGLRLVRDGHQVPFFLVPAEERSLSLSAQSSFDAKANRTHWTLALPRASSQWKRLELAAHGVFQRQLRLDWRPVDAVQWVAGGAWTWTHASPGSDRLVIGAGPWAGQDSELRLTMEHGDNQALSLDSVTAFYGVEELAFVDGQGGPLQLWGGNPKAAAPSYDLDLLRDGLEGLQPGRIEAADPVPVARAWWSVPFSGPDSGLAWFYAALGAATLGLLLVIGKLLPKGGA